MKKTICIIGACLISLSTFAQKKPVKAPLPPPPIAKRPEMYTPDIRNPFANEISFRWQNLPDTLTLITTKDLVEKSYTFSNYGKNVRVSTVYPKADFKYKKTVDGVVSQAEGLTVHYQDYSNVVIKDGQIKLINSDGEEEVRLQVTLKSNQPIRLKEISSGKIFEVTKRYTGEPTISF